jgi:hypothetical protein
MKKFRVPRKLKKKIPKNIPYCYTPIKFDMNTGIYHIKPCPFYKHIKGIDGFCKLLKCEVEDQCKSCGIKM